MGKNSFANYGIQSQYDISNTVAAGRYSVQQSDERRIFFDVVTKLDIQPQDSVLDIGCGSGLLLHPLSHITSSVIGIDHPLVIQRLRSRGINENVSLIPGDFLEIDINELRFSKIIAYGVVQYLSNIHDLNAFIDKAIACLFPGGKMLIGDLPNASKKRRFMNSNFGKEFHAEWNKTLTAESVSAHSDYLLPPDECVSIDDNIVLSLVSRLRNSGYESYILKQPHNLPFGYSREDLLVELPLG